MKPNIFTTNIIINPNKYEQVLTFKFLKMTIQQVAQIAHEINKSYCESIADFSQTSWEDAPQWQKDSAINGVTFHIENPNAGADASHNSWLKEKVDAGWVYGEIKDPEAKTHPCIVAFEMLPTFQQSKDYLFKQVVHSLKSFIIN